MCCPEAIRQAPIHDCLTPKQARLVVEYITSHLLRKYVDDLATLAGSVAPCLSGASSSFRKPARY